MFNRTVSKNEKHWIIIYAMILMGVTTLPYLFGYFFQGDEWVFSGFVFGVEDGNSYIAKMLRGAKGAWLFRTPYTTYHQNGVVAFLPYLLLGKLAGGKAIHEQLVALFHMWRFFAGFVFVFATYDFISLFIKQIRFRKLGVIMISMGGGLGWLAILLGNGKLIDSLPLDMISPESFGFLSLYGLPHLIIARALLLWGLAWYISPELMQNYSVHIRSRFLKRNLHGLTIGILWLLLGLFQPLTNLIGWFVILLYWTGIIIIHHIDNKAWYINREDIKEKFHSLILAIALSLPIVIYNGIKFSFDPFLILWTKQNRIVSPHPIHLLIAYGVLIPFVLLSLWHIWISKDRKGLFLGLWVISLPVLVYAPTNLQRRLAEGIWVSIVILSLKAFIGVSIKNNRLLTLYSRIALISIFPTTLFLLLGGINAAVHPGEPAFIKAEEYNAFEFAESHLYKNDIVLSSFRTGNALPAYAPVLVVIGHGPESVGLSRLSPMVKQFFSGDLSQSEQVAFLSEQQVDYVFWGDSERELGNWDPIEADYLIPFYHSAGYWLFQVNLEILQ